MKKFIGRVIIALIGLPILYLVIIVFPQLHYLALNVVILALTLIGAFEVQNFFVKSNIPVFKYCAPILSASLVIVTYLEITFLKNITSLTYKWLIISLMFIAIRSIFTVKKKDLSKILPILSSSSFIIIYPGLFTTYIIRILMISETRLNYVLLFFIALVFSNEILAYVFGKFFGQGTKLNFAISPNKSLVGFISGFLGSIASAIAFYYLVPQMFSTHLVNVILFGSLIALSSIFGDLFESAMKRSANVKDSGTLMMGRGGVLDTLDSFLLSAPVFFLLFPLLS